MRTTVDIPEDLLRNARELGGTKTCRETVVAALEEYVRSLGRRKIIADFGKLEFTIEPRALRNLDKERMRRAHGRHR